MKEKRKKTKTKKQTNKQREKRTRRGTEFLLEYYETFRTAHLYNTSQWPIL